MGDALVTSVTHSWVSKPERSPQRLTKAQKERLRRAEVDHSVSETSTRTGIETAGMQAQALDALARFAITSITDRTLQARQEAVAAGLAGDIEYEMNTSIALRALAVGYGRIGSRLAGNSW